jgi:hypothetical protein
VSTKRLLCIATGLAFVVTTSITAAPAFAGDEAPSDAVQALDQVPGLADAATPNTSTDLSTDSLGFTAPTTSGDEVSLERASAEPSNVRLGNDGQQVATDSSKDTDTVVQQLAGGGGRIVEVLNSSDAPDAFTYNLHVPDGSTIAK